MTSESDRQTIGTVGQAEEQSDRKSARESERERESNLETPHDDDRRCLEFPRPGYNIVAWSRGKQGEGVFYLWGSQLLLLLPNAKAKHEKNA